MKKASEYREHAKECRDMAAKARSQEDRETLLHMANTWEELATAREKQNSRKGT